MTEPTKDLMEADDLDEDDDIELDDTETEEPPQEDKGPPVRPEKTIRNTAAIYFGLALLLLLCMGLFAAIFGRSWLLLAFVPAIAVQFFIGRYYLGVYNKALTAFELYEQAQQKATESDAEPIDDDIDAEELVGEPEEEE